MGIGTMQFLSTVGVTAAAKETIDALTPPEPEKVALPEDLSPEERKKRLDNAQSRALRATLAARGRSASIGARESILGASRVSARRTLGGF